MIAQEVFNPAGSPSAGGGPKHPILIRKAAVLGAGTMGSRIAAHLANAGLPVVLLDIPGPEPVPAGLYWFVSSVIAFLKDQVDALLAGGIAATFLNSSLGAGRIAPTAARIASARISPALRRPRAIGAGRAFERFAKVERELDRGR